MWLASRTIHNEGRCAVYVANQDCGVSVMLSAGGVTCFPTGDPCRSSSHLACRQSSACCTPTVHPNKTVRYWYQDKVWLARCRYEQVSSSRTEFFVCLRLLLCCLPLPSLAARENGRSIYNKCSPPFSVIQRWIHKKTNQIRTGDRVWVGHRRSRRRRRHIQLLGCRP